MIKSALAALAYTRYAIATTLANEIGRMVLTTLAVVAIGFAIVDVGNWLVACQLIGLGAFSVAGASLTYRAGVADGKRSTERPTRS